MSPCSSDAYLVVMEFVTMLKMHTGQQLQESRPVCNLVITFVICTAGDNFEVMVVKVFSIEANIATI